MKHHIRMLACGVALLAALACGSKQTMASKSAAAFDEATKKGIAVGAGEHGGHAAEPPAAAATETDHAAMPGHGAMAGMSHAQMPAADHAHTSGMDHAATPGTDHSRMPGMQHGASNTGAHDMGAMDHSTTPGIQHGAAAPSMPGMDHSAMPGMQHGSATPAPIVITPPTSNAAIAQMQPAATLQPDDFDAPAPTAVQEAAKAAAGMTHAMEGAAPSQHEHPPAPAPTPPPPPEHHHHGNGEAS